MTTTVRELDGSINLQLGDGGPGKVLSIANYGGVAQRDILPRIVGDQSPGSTLALSETGITGVLRRKWRVNGVDVAGEEGMSFLMPVQGAVSCELLCDQGLIETPPVEAYGSHHSQMHGTAEAEMLRLIPHAEASHVAVADGDWSDPAIWDVRSVPSDCAIVLIPDGRSVRYDMSSSPRIDRIRVDGALTWALDKSTELLVETLLVTKTGVLEIGTGHTNRLPEQFQARIIISGCSCGIDPHVPTDMDITVDPSLMGRGVLGDGVFRAFGAFRTRYVQTADGNAPLASNNVLAFDTVPSDWQVGDTIDVPGTRAQVVNRVFVEEQERRTIVAKTSTSVTLDAPLIYNHDHHAPSVTRTDLQPPIVNLTGNIEITSEITSPSHRRGHTMFMHSAVVDWWDVRHIELGRTDKSINSGVKTDGQLRVFDDDAYGLVLKPFDAQSNIQSRYPAHLHFLGFGRETRPIIANCVVDGTPGWGMVHHGCDADLMTNVITKFQGAGMVSEEGSEIGAWSGNVVYGVRSTCAGIGFLKSKEATWRNNLGDFFTTGIAFAMRNRVMRTTDNWALAASDGYAFYHRATSNPADSIAPPKGPPRGRLDVYDLKPIRDNTNLNQFYVDVPINHFTDNWAFGCFAGLQVLKSDGEQHHDLNVKFLRLRTAATWMGVMLNYVGAYTLRDFDMVGIDLDAYSKSARSKNRAFIVGGNVQQVAVVDATVENFRIPVETINSDELNGVSPVDFSQDTPRFIIAGLNAFNCPSLVPKLTDGSIQQNAVDVNLILPVTPPYVEPTTDLPFIVAHHDESGAIPGGVGNYVSGFKTDSVGSQVQIPMPWDDKGLRFSAHAATFVKRYAELFGVWTYQGQSILRVPYYFSDQIYGTPNKFYHAILMLGDTSIYDDNGVFEFSDHAPIQANFSVTCAPGATVTIDPLNGAIAAPGRTLRMDNLIDPAHGNVVENFTAGTFGYTRDTFSTADDLVHVFITDESRFTRVDVTITAS